MNPLRRSCLLAVFALTLAASLSAQSTYRPKFPGDPARSEDEAAALGYVRTVVRAQKIYNRRHQQYATSLHDLINQGSFTRRMVQTDRGAYQVNFHGKKESFALALTPKQFDPVHRAFYSDQDGKIRVDESKPAGPDSPVLK
jgi:hypothetical protein